jgi:chemotaxis protein CheZ
MNAHVNATAVIAPGSADVIPRIASVTRLLRDSMRELGLDEAIRDVAAAIPDTCDRLRYVAQMTERAAERTLNAAERAQPLQDALARDARALSARWRPPQNESLDTLQMHELIRDSKTFLDSVPARAQATQTQLREIVMAQDFQDLTGQVILKMMDVIGAIETELLQVLLDNVSPERREEANALLNGPQTKPAGKSDIVTNQDQVDGLLASLGF